MLALPKKYCDKEVILTWQHDLSKVYISKRSRQFIAMQCYDSTGMLSKIFDSDFY